MASVTMDFFSEMMGRNVTVKLFLPFDKTYRPIAPGEKYKTLYFLHGMSGDAEETSVLFRLAEQAALKGLAVVLMNGENSFYVDQPAIQAYHSRFVAQELRSVMQRLFPLSDKREDTFIGGNSMGGFGALMLSARYPETYAKVIALSPATDAYSIAVQGILPRAFLDHLFVSEENYRREWDPYALLLRAKQEKKPLPKLFFCCGKQDPSTLAMTQKFAEQLGEAKIAAEYLENDGIHDIMYWNEMMPAAFDFLLA